MNALLTLRQLISMRFIRIWIVVTFILTFLVIIAGGVVRTTQSGMGCPDWPTCFGRWIPPTNASQLPPDFEKYLQKQDIDHTFNALHTWIEYINRLLTALLSLFAIGQCILLFSKRNRYPKAFKLSLAYIGMVLVTALFGAMVVKLNLAQVSISVHFLLAIILLEIQLGLLLSFQSKLFSVPVDSKMKKLFFVFLFILLIQVALGITVRMYVDNVSKILHYEQRETWLANMPVSFLIHRSFSWLVLLSTFLLSWYCKNIPAIRNKIFVLTGIILLSMATGIILFYADMPAVAQPIHLLLASLAITQIMLVILQTKATRNMQPA
jgi:cytochrome c oxidase assembly protein subunit 15